MKHPYKSSKSHYPMAKSGFVCSNCLKGHQNPCRSLRCSCPKCHPELASKPSKA